MPYALYDAPSGTNRDTSMFRSKYASPETPTFVEMTFSCGGKVYTVKRNPEYERPARRGSKMTRQRAEAELHLPDGSGYDVCKAIKAKDDTPVIFLTAFDDEVNVVMGLELGADDYISKPFRLRELMARIKTVLRRSKGAATEEIRISGLTVRMKEGKVLKNGQEVILTALEYKLLLTFLQNRGRVLSRNMLLESIWDVAGDFVSDNTLSVYIKRLREKIEDDPVEPQIIKTVRGMGYKVDE